MPLEMRPLMPSDLEAWVRIHYLAFLNSTISCMWRSEPSLESFSIIAQSRGAALLAKEPTAYFFKVIDTDLSADFDPQKWRNEPGKRATGNTIAVAKWHVYEQARSEDEVRAGFTLAAPFPEECRGAREKFMVNIFKSRWEVMGTRPHVILGTLTTHPDHHRRGAGGMLVRWGNERADELGLESYLEGSRDGRGLYQKCGFRPVREFSCDLSEFGGEDDLHVVSLISLWSR